MCDSCDKKPKKEKKEKKPKKVKDIRSVKLYLPKNLNTGKKKQIDLMREQYLDSARYHLPIGWNYQNLNPDTVNLPALAAKQKRFPKKADLYVPKRNANMLSGRSESFVRDQVQGIINSKRHALLKDFHIAGWCHEQGFTEAAKSVQRRISRALLSLRCPEIKTMNMELSSKVVKIKDRASPDDKFVFMFASMWDENAKPEINPSNKFNVSVPANTRTRYWERKGYTLKSGVLVGDGWIEVRFEKEIFEVTDTDVTLVIDQGANALITAALSTGEKYASRPNKHGKDLKSLIAEYMRRKPGSKSRKRCVKDIANYVRYAVNTMFKYFGLDKGRIKTLILEDVRKMQGKNKFLSVLPFGVLRDCLEEKCKEYGIKFKFQGNAYRSQRCSHCGFVHKNNRKGKVFLCRKCNYAADADENAVDNHFADIPTISYQKNKRKLDNRKNGFYWLSDGLITGPDKFPPIVKYNQ